MSSTLCMRPTPRPPASSEVSFKHPVKAIIARRFYDHDGSLGGGLVTVGTADLAWFEGVLAAEATWDKSDRRDFEKMVGLLRSGKTVDMWFEI